MEFAIVTLDEMGAAGDVVRRTFEDGMPVWIADDQGDIQALVIAVPRQVRAAYWQPDLPGPALARELAQDLPLHRKSRNGSTQATRVQPPGDVV